MNYTVCILPSQQHLHFGFTFLIPTCIANTRRRVINTNLLRDSRNSENFRRRSCGFTEAIHRPWKLIKKLRKLEFRTTLVLETISPQLLRNALTFCTLFASLRRDLTQTRVNDRSKLSYRAVSTFNHAPRRNRRVVFVLNFGFIGNRGQCRG